MISAEQAKTALDLGFISPETYGTILAGQPQATPIPAAPVAAPIAAPVAEPVVPGRNEVDWTKVQERIPQGGVLAQGVQDEARQRMNFRNTQVPAPLALPTETPQVIPQETQEVQAMPVQAEPVVQEEAMPIDIPKAQAEVQKGVEQGAYQAAAQKGFQDQIATQENRIRELQKQKDDAWKAASQDLAKADAEMDKIQPKDFWADKSTGTKIGAALAIALGGFGSGMTGGQNNAMNIINGAIERDMNLQRERYNRAKEKKANIKSNLGDQISMLGDQEAAELQLINNAYKKAEFQIRQMEAKTTDQIQKLNAQKLIGEINAKQVETAQKLQERIIQQKLARGGTSGINPELLPEAQRERYVDDQEFSGLARTTKEAQDFRGSLPAYKNTITSLNRLLEISNMPLKSLSPELRAEADQINYMLGGDLRADVLGPGTVTPEERAIVMNKILADPTRLIGLDSTVKVRLKNLAQKIQAKKLEQAKAIGLNSKTIPTAANSVMVRTPDGRTVRIARSSLKTAQERAKNQGITLEVLND